MLKKFLIIICVFFVQYAFAQNTKYFTRNAVITFDSDAPMEKIHASNKQVNCILNTATNDVAIKVVMKSFEFEKQAMQEHFNNDYVESDKFPNATFEGKISTAIDYTKNAKNTVTVHGKLTIHGVSKPIKQTGTIEVSNGKITLKSNFSIKLSDYGVKVPNDFVKKISNTVQIDINAVTTPYVR